MKWGEPQELKWDEMRDLLAGNRRMAVEKLIAEHTESERAGLWVSSSCLPVVKGMHLSVCLTSA
jgi:hypothetical protein